MITAPDEIYSVAEAAQYLRKSERQVLRYLEAGKLSGCRPAGRWQIPAIALWSFQGIAEEMRSIWIEYCLRLEVEQSDGGWLRQGVVK